MKQHFPAILLALLFIAGCTDRTNVPEQTSITTSATTISSFSDGERSEEHTASTSSEITEPTQGISSEPTQESEPDIISAEPPAPETTPAAPTSTTTTIIEIAAETPVE